MGEGAGQQMQGQGSLPSFLSLCIPPHPPSLLPCCPQGDAPSQLTQAQFKCPVSALSTSTATNLPCSPEMCPLLA